MLVVHANWTGGALHLWAESLDALVRGQDEFAHAGGNGVDATGAVGGGATATAATTVTAPDHPFSLSAAEFTAALGEAGHVNGAAADVGTLELRLPAVDGRPLPSDRLVGLVASDDRRGEARLESFCVPSVTLRGDQAIATLLAMEDGGASASIDFGHALRYWMTVARFVLELLADQRFIPTLIQPRDAELRAAWQPWLHDEAARARAGALLAAMPPIVRAVADEYEGRPWSILGEALGALTDATVRRALTEDDFADAVDGRDGTEDPHVAWLEGLLGTRDRVMPGADRTTELLRDVGRWIATLDEHEQDRPLRLCLELHEPDETSVPGDLEPISDRVTWRLSLHLMGSEDGAERIDAEQIWRDPAAARGVVGGGVRDPEELLLAELDRAARLYPPLESALSDAEPTGIDLTTGQASAFLCDFIELLGEAGIGVIVPEWWGQASTRLGARLVLDAPEFEPPPVGSVGVAAAGSSLLGLSSIVKYRWQVAVGDQPLGMDEFRALAGGGTGGSLVRLHGRWVQLEPDQLSEAAQFLDAKPDGEMTLLEAIQVASGAGSKHFGLPVTGMEASGWVADLLGASSGAGRMPRLAQPSLFKGKLRPYQEVGLSGLSFLDQFGLGACLADDMGLGKTIQLIALLQSERQNSPDGPGPTLLVVPTSVVSNWRRELERFAPELRVHVHHGPDRPVGDRLVEMAGASDVVITTYTLVSRDRETLTRTPWYRVVLDEAQYIKNPPTKQTATIQALKTTRRIALTGTPVENRLSELWSIMEFCNPGYLGQPGEFRRRFSVPVERHRDQERAEQLRQLVRPFVLRRLKTDPSVIDDLPPCVVTKEYATLTGEQAALYERTVNEMLGQVSRAEGIQRRGLVLATLVKLKQICNHPAQISDGDSAEAIESATGGGLLSGRSGKSSRLMRMLEEVVATGDKALLFTQFRRMGHLLGAMIKHDLDTEVMFLHGGTPPARRQQMIDRFQAKDGGVPIFVLSLKAGGIGVNLTAANHVFHFDRWWNPAVENQATDRAFRIGQTRTVHVHKFVCLGTLEERIDQMIEQKTELARNIIGAGEDWLSDLSTGQLRELLTLRRSAMEAEQ
jgi:hypothetical protein